MTTIVYHHKTKTIAYDSRLTIGDQIATDTFNKHFTVNGRHFFLCGNNFSDNAKAMEAFPDSVDIKSSPYGLIAADDKVFWSTWDDGAPSAFEVCFNIAAGSGEMYALSAMDCGLGAVEAVKIAIGRDVYSGGEVKVFKL